ncbi:hypothetical protein MferCBS31731_000412 [Microsporum ferrugineum]
MADTSKMENQMDGMAVCEPISTNESMASVGSTQSTGNIKTAYPRFMTMIDPALQIFPQSSSLIRRPSADRSKQRPETPTRSLPVSSSRLRQKTWASVASKGVDAIRSSAKSTNYSKRTPYRNGQSSGVGSYRLISVTQTEQQSTPCPDKTKREYNYNSCAESLVDKALPSDKPLPCPPESTLNVDMTSDLTSRTIINTKENVLPRSPPEAPREGDDWPVLTPGKAKNETNNDNRQNNEAKLTRIDEEGTCEPIPDGVQMFANALSKLTKATEPCKATISGHAEEKGSGPEKNTVEIPVSSSSKWNTSSPYQSPINIPFSASKKPLPLKIVTDFSKNSVSSERPFAFHGLGVSPNYHSRVPKPNPFRDRPRIASSPCGAISLPIRDIRASSCSFENTPSSVKTPRAVTSKEQPTGTPTRSNPFYTGSPRTDRSSSRIPRMSPRALFPSSESDSGSGNGSKASLFSPSKRSSIPLPTRLLQQTKEDDIIGNLLKGVTPSAIFDRVENTRAEMATTELDSPNRSKGGAISAHHTSHTDLQKETQSLEERADPFSDEITVKQLSKSAPSHGPQLRISPEAERLIMGEDDIKLLERNTRESGGPSRQSGSKREFRLSTDSLFATFSSKRSKNSSYRLSFSGKSSMGENSPTPAGGATGKSIPKAKSADFGLHRVSSGHRPTRRKSSSGKELSCPASERVEADPFLDTEDKVLDFKQASPAQADCESIMQPGQLNEDPCDSPVIESIKKSSIPLAVENTSPPKTPGPVERARRSHNEVLKINSPKSPRHTSRISASYGSPRRYPHRQSTDRAHHRPKPNNDNHNGVHQLQSLDTENPGQKEKRHKKRHHRSADPISVAPEAAKAKGSAAKGVFSNFRGLFTKHKPDAPKENTRHLLSDVKPMATNHVKLSVPASHSVPHLGTNGNGHQNADFNSRHLEPPRSPALRDTGRISSITMEILDSARNEVDTTRKEKLIRLGKILIEAVNNSHDAEKAMLTAIQAAKEAEVACAMAKENAMKTSQVACDWARPLAPAKNSNA